MYVPRIALYSLLSVNAVQCKFSDMGDNLVELLPDTLGLIKYHKGIPVVLGKIVDDAVRIYGGCIVDYQKNKLLVNIAPESFGYTEKRLHERVVTSLQADIRNGRKREECYIKDMSFSGMCLLSKTEAKLDTKLELDVYLGLNIVPVQCKVVRCKYIETIEMYELGVAVSHTNGVSYTHMKNIKSVMDEQYQKVFEKVTYRAVQGW